MVRGGGSVGAVQLTWLLLNSTDDDDDDSPVIAGRHEFLLTSGDIVFNVSQKSANLTVSIINDFTPSLDTSYRLMITNVSQVTVITRYW